MSRLWESGFRHLGLTAPQAYMLVFIIRNAGVLPNQIAKEMNLDKSTVSRAIDGLVTLKLVKRVASESDTRSVLVHATAKGRQLEDQIVSASRRLNASLRNKVEAEKVESLVHTLRDLTSRLRGQ